MSRVRSYITECALKRAADYIRKIRAEHSHAMLRRLGRWLTAATLLAGAAPQRPDIIALDARGVNPTCVDASVRVPALADSASGIVGALQFISEDGSGSSTVPVYIQRVDAFVDGCFNARGAFTVSLEVNGVISNAWRVDNALRASRAPPPSPSPALQSFSARIRPGYLDAAPFALPIASIDPVPTMTAVTGSATAMSVRLAPPAWPIAPPYGRAIVAFPSDQPEWPGGGAFSSPIEAEVMRTLGEAPFRIVNSTRRNGITLTITAQHATPPLPAVPRFIVSPASGWRAASRALESCRSDLVGIPPTVISYAWDPAVFRSFDADTCLDGGYTKCMDTTFGEDTIVASAVSVTVWAATDAWWGDPRCWLPVGMPQVSTFLRNTFARPMLATFDPRLVNGTLERWSFTNSTGPAYGWSPAVMRMFYFGMEGPDPRGALRSYMIARGALNVTFLDEVVFQDPPGPPPPAPTAPEPPATSSETTDTSVRNGGLGSPPPSPRPPYPPPYPPLPPGILYAVQSFALPSPSATSSRTMQLAIASLSLACSALACSLLCCCFACVLGDRERKDVAEDAETCAARPVAWDKNL